MALKALQTLGDMLCEAIHFIKKDLGVKNSILDKADDICETILPDLEHIDVSHAEELARAAYDMAKRVKKTLSS